MTREPVDLLPPITEASGDPVAAEPGPGPAPRTTAPPAGGLVGHMVGEYEVVAIIGDGGMGTVYSGIQPLIGKRVAIKVLKASHAEDPIVVQRFLAEAQAVNRINHPNIVDVFSFGSLENGAPYFVMEYLEGKSLLEHLNEADNLPYGQALAIMRPILDALEAAHKLGIVHRDLKPGNIHLGRRDDGTFDVRILDFGIAKFKSDDVIPSRTRTGAAIGTPEYMSPEQCRGRGVDEQTDIYALGVLLYCAFTGKLPFTGESYFEILDSHVSKEPMPPHLLVDLPVYLEATILRCLAKDKRDRFATIAELRRQLIPQLEALAKLDAQAAPLAVDQAAVAGQHGDRPSPTTAATMAAVPAPSRWRAGRVVRLGVLAALLLAAAGVALTMITQRVRPTDAVALAPAASAPGAPVALPDAAPEPRVTIQFLLTPVVETAEISVDGRKLSRPAVETRQSTTQPLEVRVSAPGYEPYVGRVLPVSNLALPVTLVKVATPPNPGRVVPGAAGAPKGQAGAPPAPKPRDPRVKRIEDL
jgi:eukaryotic-like serine/threonine-protein kinase